MERLPRSLHRRLCEVLATLMRIYFFCLHLKCDLMLKKEFWCWVKNVSNLFFLENFFFSRFLTRAMIYLQFDCIQKLWSVEIWNPICSVSDTDPSFSCWCFNIAYFQQETWKLIATLCCCQQRLSSLLICSSCFLQYSSIFQAKAKPNASPIPLLSPLLSGIFWTQKFYSLLFGACCAYSASSSKNSVVWT